MPDRINTPLTNEHFAAFCLSMLGQPYWYGTALHKCSESLRASKARQYPSHYGSSRTSRYRDDIAKKKVCADCMGGAKGYAWTSGGQGVQHRILAAGHAGIGRDAFAQRKRRDIRFHFSYDLFHDSTSFTAIFALLPTYSKINLRSRG